MANKDRIKKKEIGKRGHHKPDMLKPEERCDLAQEALEEDRKVRSRNKNIPLETILEMIDKKEMGVCEVARQLGVSHQVISKRLNRYAMHISGLKSFKKYKADILSIKQSELINSMSEEEIAAASIKDRTVMFGIFYDKERLERGQATEIHSVEEMDQSIEALEAEEQRLLIKLGKKKAIEGEVLETVHG